MLFEAASAWNLKSISLAIILAQLIVQSAEGIKFLQSKDPVIARFARKHPSKTADYQRAKKEGWPVVFTPDNPAPVRAFGRPGLSLLDVDLDGDLDIFVPAGDRQANRLFLNQLQEEGEVRFKDASKKFNVQLKGLDCNGVCSCDIDNDGDEDLIILNSKAPWSLLRNDRGEVFENISIRQNDTSEYEPSSCTCGDVDGDGLVDLLISTTFININGIGASAFEFGRPNQLYINQGPDAEQHFVDETELRGLGGYEGKNNGTWSAALVDFDLDGDLDAFFFDDRAAVLGTGRGMVKLYTNDGKGNFQWATEDVGGFSLENAGSNMGHDFGDLNCDGNVDFFVTRLGSIQTRLLARATFPPEMCFLDESSQWGFGSAAGRFTFPGLGDMKSNMFGWGARMMDIENDGDLDIVHVGGMVSGDAGIVTPGAVYENTGHCSGTFRRSGALADGAYNTLVMSGMASGDFNNDCFPDYAAISGARVSSKGLVPLNDTSGGALSECVVGSPFMRDAFRYPTFARQGNSFPWVNPVGLKPEKPGKLVLEVNDAASSNGGVRVKFRGSVGDLRGGVVNRDGTGAVVSFTPQGMKTVMRPLTSGDLHSSSDKRQLFGMGAARKATVIVQWPGSPKPVFNALDIDLDDPRLSNPGRTLLFPEIPCDFRGNLKKFNFRGCVAKNVVQLRRLGVVDAHMGRVLRRSMMKAYEKAHPETI